MYLSDTEIRSFGWQSNTFQHLNSLYFWQYYCKHLDFFEINFFVKMDASENNQKNSNNTLNDWFSNPFERVNHSTNFEDYACAPDDNNYLNTNSTSYVKKATIPSINKEMGSTSLKLTNKANVWNYLSDPRDHSSSAEVTPSGSPQNSPYSIRKSMEGKKVSKNGTNELSLNNSKRWFYSGFFNTDLKAGLEDKPMTKTSSFKNLCVSNFDINAVGPTSW